ncbi:hypothetical protein GGI25_005780 [Coemansia spiralis]|uniref:Uncharacterized protein n=2 Tax=Coemansia TaxID=4863 RepID=A0A9W8KVF0_9FUNG|nr:transferase [Coemansia spiralis]KAJ1987379.1 hypothetical protein EDC05_005879 [Coemansia umbellata]KAJ2619276.1 hypothetical protein GGI26_005955 [Coemansia sp. RSA 1358]KAJ2670611.1 hypothetical protein GGI25_005780 [Coemansia spiralis]
MVIAINKPHPDDAHKRAYALAPIDLAQGNSHIMFVYFYENKRGLSNFMPTDVLFKGFLQAANHFSILLGYLESDTKHGTVLMDNANPNVPHFEEKHSDSHFNALAKHNYHWDKWPLGLDTQDIVEQQAGKIPLLSTLLMRFADNSGVALRVKIRHSVMDGNGFTLFMNIWSSSIYTGKPSTCNPDTEFIYNASFDFDRSALLSAANYITTTNNIKLDGKKSQAPADNSTGSHLLAKRLHRMHIIRFSANALDRLKVDFSPNDGTISINDALTSLLWRAYARTSSKATNAHLMLACDIRKRIALLSNYMGNASFPLRLEMKQEHLLNSFGHTIASEIRKIVSSVDKKYVHECLAFLDLQEPIADAEKWYNDKSSFFCTTNCSRFSFYKTDFGFGCPEKVLVPHYLTPGFSIWVPTKESRGIDAILSTFDKCFEKLSIDAELLKYGQIIL